MSIQQFAKKQMGIELNSHQIALIRAWARGDLIHAQQRAGWITAKRVALAYLEAGCNGGA